jgi:hypothetical protein
LSPISSEESNKTLQKTLSQGFNCKGNCKCRCLNPEDALNTYREAAESDAYLFGDYDYGSEWMNDIEGL